MLRSKRRSIGFLIDDAGLRITAPRWVSIAQIEAATREKGDWIFAKLRERQDRASRRAESTMHWQDGGKLPYAGKEITLRLVETEKDSTLYDAELATLTIGMAIGTAVGLAQEAREEQLKNRVRSWLQEEAKTLFAARLPIYAQALGVQYQSFKLSSAKTQWGSCTADGRIRLNWRLMHFALPLVDYVIAHELSHRKEMNHGPRFWATVRAVFPEYEAARKELRSHPPERLPVF